MGVREAEASPAFRDLQALVTEVSGRSHCSVPLSVRPASRTASARWQHGCLSPSCFLSLTAVICTLSYCCPWCISGATYLPGRPPSQRVGVERCSSSSRGRPGQPVWSQGRGPGSTGPQSSSSRPRIPRSQGCPPGPPASFPPLLVPPLRHGHCVQGGWFALNSFPHRSHTPAHCQATQGLLGPLLNAPGIASPEPRPRQAWTSSAFGGRSGFWKSTRRFWKWTCSIKRTRWVVNLGEGIVW